MNRASGECVFCGGSRTRTAFPVTDIFGITRNLQICCDCNTWFYDPQPSSEELLQAYSDTYYGKAETKFRWNIVERVVDFYRKRRALNLRKLTGGKGSVLDIGCGNGRVIHFLASRGNYQVYGTEMPGISAERARQYPEINLFAGTFEEARYAPNSFDAITLFHVFEHLPRPVKALEKISLLLKPGGVLIMSFPNIHSMQAQCLKAHWLHLDPPRHLFFPHPEEIKKFLDQRGFRLISQRFFSPEQNPAGAVQGLLNLMSGKRDLLFERMKGNRNYLPETSPVRLALHKIFFVMAMPLFILSDIFESLFCKGATITLIFKKLPDHGNN